MCEVGREEDSENQLKFQIESILDGGSGDVILVHNEASEGQLKFYAETPVAEKSEETIHEENAGGQLKFHADTLEPESSETILAKWNTDAVRGLSINELLAELEEDPIIASRFTARNPSYSKQLSAKDPKVPIVEKWFGKSKARVERRSQEMDRKRRGEDYHSHYDSKRSRTSDSPCNYNYSRNQDSRNSYGYGNSYGHHHTHGYGGHGHGHGYYNNRGHDNRSYDRNHDRSFDRGYDRGFDRNRDRRHGGHDRYSNSHNDRM